MWNQRFSEEKFAYGKEPNDFLASIKFEQPQGQVMCLAEGQGRNAVYLAGLGFEVTAVDLSEVGLKRTRELAAERNVQVHTICADLSTFEIEQNSQDGIVMIFGHTPPLVKKHVHMQIASGLKPGGFLALEGYSKDQLKYKTGGPPVAPLLYSLEELMADFDHEFDWIVAHEIEREIIEGEYHNGNSAVVQLYGRKR